jgi:hypothetical protein
LLIKLSDLRRQYNAKYPASCRFIFGQEHLLFSSFALNSGELSPGDNRSVPECEGGQHPVLTTHNAKFLPGELLDNPIDFTYGKSLNDQSKCSAERLQVCMTVH